MARMEGTADLDWFAAQVWSGREMFSAEQLRMRGYDVFLPCYRERRRWSDRIKTIERALFAGYVFCRLPADRLLAASMTPGVIRVVGDGRAPLPIPAEEVEAIRRAVNADLQVEPWEYIRVGEQVRVEHGPLRGAEGTVLRAKDRQRLIIAIPLLQRAVAVELRAEWLSAPRLSPQLRVAAGLGAR